MPVQEHVIKETVFSRIKKRFWLSDH